MTDLTSPFNTPGNGEYKSVCDGSLIAQERFCVCMCAHVCGVVDVCVSRC